MDISKDDEKIREADEQNKAKGWKEKTQFREKKLV